MDKLKQSIPTNKDVCDETLRCGDVQQRRLTPIMQLMLYNTTDLKIEWLLWALSDVWLLPATSSATVRKADARFTNTINANGLFC